MPELPEVETIAAQLHAGLAGRTVRALRVHRRDVIHGHALSLTKCLAGRRIDRVVRHGKRIVFWLSGRVRVVFHLGMSGRLELAEKGVPIEKHTHLRMSLTDSAGEVRYRDPRRFGGVWLLTEGCPRWRGRPLSELGPDPLQLAPADFIQVLRGRRGIKALLLDQRIVSGLGNIYCDESLHRAGIHPSRRADQLTDDEARRLGRAIRSVLRSAIRHRGSSIIDYRDAAGRSGGFQRYHRGKS